MKKRIKTAFAPILTAVALTVALTGCGAGSKTMSDVQPAEATTAAAMDYKMQAPGSAMGQGEAATSAETEAASSVLTSTNTMQPIATNRKLIRNVNLSVETTSFDTMISSLTGAVTGSGGYIEQSTVSGNSVSSTYDSNRYASLTVRVPSDKLDTFITLVAEQGNITNKDESTQDVTLQYSDVESRKKSLTIEQERIWALLEKADTLEAVIALESRLSEIRYQLESFESQLRTYDNQVDYSTVYIHITEVKIFTPTSPDSITTRIQKGFSRNLNNVADGMTNFFIWLISSLPVIVLLLVIAAIVLLILRLTAKKRPQKERQPRYKKGQKQQDPQTPIIPLTQPLPTTKPQPNTTKPSISEPLPSEPPAQQEPSDKQ